jgi:hypothetical protein
VKIPLKINLYFSLIIIPVCSLAQNQEGILDSIQSFSGRLIDAQTDGPIQFAHIINQTRNYAVISDTLGYFSIPVRQKDLLVVTEIGYYDLPIYISDSVAKANRFHIYRMIPKVYAIKEININRLGTYGQFKYNFLNLDLPEQEHPANPSVFNDIEKGIDTLDLIETFSIGSPITAIYNLVSKEGKSLRKLKKLKAEEEFWKQVEYKYNLEMLERITGMKGVELYEFISFCNFGRKFILRASEYEIIETVLDKLKEYRKKTTEYQIP